MTDPDGRLNELFARLEKLEEKIASTRVWDILFKAMLPVAVLAGSAIVGTLVSHGERITHIEASRFTHQDGLALRAAIQAGIPPQWLSDQLAELKQYVIGIESRLRVIEQRK